MPSSISRGPLQPVSYIAVEVMILAISMLYIHSVDMDGIDGYKLMVEHVAPSDPESNEHSCSLTQETVFENVSRVNINR